MSRVALGEFEHHVMLALQRLGGRAHSAPVVAELELATGESVFIALRRLEKAPEAKGMGIGFDWVGNTGTR